MKENYDVRDFVTSRLKKNFFIFINLNFSNFGGNGFEPFTVPRYAECSFFCYAECHTFTLTYDDEWTSALITVLPLLAVVCLTE
jgi:hypothetical protein